MLYFLLYLADFSISLKVMSALVLFGLIFALAHGMIDYNYYFDYPGKEQVARDKVKQIKISIIGIIISILIFVFTPNQKTIYTMAGIYCGKQISETVQLTEKMKKVSEIIDLNLNKTIQELKK